MTAVIEPIRPLVTIAIILGLLGWICYLYSEREVAVRAEQIKRAGRENEQRQARTERPVPEVWTASPPPPSPYQLPDVEARPLEAIRSTEVSNRNNGSGH